MGDKRIRIEKCNIDEGKFNSHFLIAVFVWIDMRLKAIEFVQ